MSAWAAARPLHHRSNNASPAYIPPCLPFLPHLQLFNLDPTKGLLDFVRYTSRNVGRLPLAGGPVAQAFNSESRVQRERLGRMLYAR